MPLRNAKKSSPKKEYVNPFEEKGYLARIVQVVDLGLQPQKDWTGGEEEKPPRYEVMVTFEFPEVRNENDQPSWSSRRYQLPTGWPERDAIKSNSNLFKLINTFLPQKLTQLDKYPDYFWMDDSVWQSLLDIPCYIEMGTTKGGNPKILSVQKVPSFAGKVPPLENKPLLFDVGSATQKDFESLFPWVQRVLTTALDEETSELAKKLLAVIKNEEIKEEDKVVRKASKKKNVKKEVDVQATDELNDDIPF